MKEVYWKVIKDIKDLKIQGAENIAINGVKALYSFLQVEEDLEEVKKFIIELVKARITEPTLRNGISNLFNKTNFDDFLNVLYDNLNNDNFEHDRFLNNNKTLVLDKKRIKLNYNEVMDHFYSFQNDLNSNVLKFVNEHFKNKDIIKIYTHCHSSTVVLSIINLKNKLLDKKIIVYNTETRPLYQGRTTALEILDAGIDVYHFVDSGMLYCIKECDIIMLGCDAIEANGDVLNKIGSGAISYLAKIYEKPLAILTDSWKKDLHKNNKSQKIEIRSGDEILDKNFKKTLENRNIYIEDGTTKVIVECFEEHTTDKGQLFINNYAFEKIPNDKIFVLITEKNYKISRDI